MSGHLWTRLRRPSADPAPQASRPGLARTAENVLDNFETPSVADPLRVEELLRVVAAVPTVAIAVSARGTARPAGLRWADFAMLSPLLLADAPDVSGRGRIRSDPIRDYF